MSMEGKGESQIREGEKGVESGQQARGRQGEGGEGRGRERQGHQASWSRPVRRNRGSGVNYPSHGRRFGL